MGERSDEMRRYDTAGNEINAGQPLSNRGRYGTPRSSPAEVDANADPDEIREDIEHTRADMSETIDAIQARLDPDRLKAEARDTVREHTIGRAEHAVSGAADTAKGAGETVMDTIRNNPVPAALAGIGIGWLVMRGRSSSHVRSYDHLGGSSSGRYQPGYGYSTLGESSGHMSQRASQYGDQAQRMAGEYAEQAHQYTDQAQERLGQYSEQAQERVGHMADQAQYQAHRVEDQVSRMMRENPLALGAVAFGIGAAVGMLVPESNKESELLGDTRDSLVDMAQETAQEKIEQAKHVAEEAQNAARQEAEEQGLTNS